MSTALMPRVLCKALPLAPSCQRAGQPPYPMGAAPIQLRGPAALHARACHPAAALSVPRATCRRTSLRPSEQSSFPALGTLARPFRSPRPARALPFGLSTIDIEPEPFVDVLGFTALAVAYSFIYNIYYFPPPAERPQVFERTPEFSRYIQLFTVVGVVLPGTWLLAGALVGGPHTEWGFRIAGPHLFLVFAQLVSERVSYGNNASLPACIMVAALYNTRRMLSLYIWVLAGLQYVNSVLAEGHVDGAAQLTWLVLGEVIAVANFLAWAYNLFFFLLPIAIPRYLKAHYETEAALAKKER